MQFVFLHHGNTSGIGPKYRMTANPTIPPGNRDGDPAMEATAKMNTTTRNCTAAPAPRTVRYIPRSSRPHAPKDSAEPIPRETAASSRFEAPWKSAT